MSAESGLSFEKLRGDFRSKAPSVFSNYNKLSYVKCFACTSAASLSLNAIIIMDIGCTMGALEGKSPQGFSSA